MLVLAYITCGSEAEARKIGKTLVEGKLAACANIFPISSIYCWEDKLQDDKEWLLIAKTVPDKFEKLEKKVKEIHSYDVPCIMGIPVVDVNEDYLDWVERQTKDG
jgi:periplasmic divalent cation tolerance protein